MGIKFFENRNAPDISVIKKYVKKQQKKIIRAKTGQNMTKYAKTGQNKKYTKSLGITQP
jgi:hypothetical protein